MTTKITISISDSLNQKLKEKIKETDFKSVGDYVLYLLKEMVYDKSQKEKVAYSDEEEAALKEKLKEMGYL